MTFTAQIWGDRQRILELISILGKVEGPREVYRLFVKAKEINPLLEFRYDVREYVRFSADEGLIHDDIEALLALGYLEESESLKLTPLGESYLKDVKPSDGIEVFTKLKER